MGIELENSFTLNMAADAAWAMLNDIERIAPCVPGAQLTAVEGDAYRGKVKVKLGPITAEYSGTATIKERDPVARRLVVEGKGKDIRGQGTAGADIVMTITPAEHGSEVSVNTDVQLSGKVAQLGRGVMHDVSARLIDQFVANLQALNNQEAADAVPDSSAAPSLPKVEKEAVAGVRMIASPEPQAIDLVQLGGASLPIKSIMVGSWMVAVLVLLVLIWLK
ncbi:SRPBCC family protein [Novosphingobium sp. FKTRR1]|uniref:SRPBCC family protein n=1 Tax=Novosphingobium sp. FKTRR1 TaxID=2879118 RepID=UPI001CF0678E|nr:SRPBCC family protein [Novosphingobium sp. FKTRR1]